jgi:nicotinamidase-related amidase
MKEPVLLVIDMLHDFLESWEPGRKERLVQSTNELVGIVRDFSCPVIWVRQEFEPDLRDALPEMKAKGIRITIKGTRGCEILSELAVAPADVVIVKKRYSAFYGTTLDRHWRESSRVRLSLLESTLTLASARPPLTHISEIGMWSWPQSVLTLTTRNITTFL